MRDKSGRFIPGYKETEEDKIKRIESCRNSWKNRKDYIGDIVSLNPKLYNSWRSIMFTKKGKKAGICEKWRNYRNFYNDVLQGYKEGLLLRRINKEKPWDIDNYIWISKENEEYLKSNAVLITYNNETLNLKDLSIKYNQSMWAIKNRYYKHKNDYTIEEVIFGKKTKRGSKKVQDADHNIRAKVSKMISSYKIKDKKNSLEICDIDIDWMITNIISKPCIYCGDTHRVGCDRINNSIGHIKSNVVPCCYECNCARNDNFSFEEMKKLGETIREIKELRK